MISPLNFEDLPVYETSSDEEEEEEAGEGEYQEGYNYIDNFYNQIKENQPSSSSPFKGDFKKNTGSFNFQNSSELRFSSDGSKLFEN